MVFVTLIKLPLTMLARVDNENGKCLCMCRDCVEGEHVGCDAGTCGYDPWIDILRGFDVDEV